MPNFEELAKKFTDKIIELGATEVAKIDDHVLEDGHDPRELWALAQSCRATLIAIRNNTLLLETAIEKAFRNKPVCTRGPVDRDDT